MDADDQLMAAEKVPPHHHWIECDIIGLFERWRKKRDSNRSDIETE